MTGLDESKKHLILISQHHWSPTASHPLPLLSLPWPPALLLLPYAFHPPHCFWKFFKKMERKVGDNMYCKHVFSEIQNENGFSRENIENFAINLCHFYSTQPTKN